MQNKQTRRHTMPHNTTNRALHSVLLLSTLAIMVLLTTTPAFAFDQACRSLFNQKQYTKAATCFQKLVQSVDKNKQFASMASLLKDRFLRDAAISWSNAANAESTPPKRAYLKEIAANTLQGSIKKGFCKASNRCDQHKQLHAQLIKEVGYGQLIVWTGKPDSNIKVTGWKHNKTHKGQISTKIRPGSYNIVISIQGKVTKTKSIIIPPNRSVLLDAKPAEIKVVVKQIIVAKTIPPLVLTGYIAGGVLLIGGTVLAILGYSTQTTLNTCRQNPDCAQNDEQYNREFDQGSTFVTIGYITAATGILVAGGGLVAHMTSGKPSPPPPAMKRSLTIGRFGYQP